MSYECEICFKQIEPEDVYDFLVEFKNKTIENLENIAEESCCWMPTIRKHLEPQNKPKYIFDADNPEDVSWAKTSIFSHRYFYNRELKLLGVYSVHRCLKYMFDASVFFQNNSDQDYDRSEWEGIKVFEEIYDKYQNMTAKEIIEKFNDSHWSIDEDEQQGKLEYARKTLAYDEIWNNFQYTLNDERTIVYVTIFGHYENYKVLEFLMHCYDKYEEKYKIWCK